MKKILALVTIATVALNFTAAAQKYGTNSQTPISDITGKPIPTSDFAKITGSTFVYNNWVPGQITTNDGQVYKGLLLKFDLKANQLTFVYDKKDTPQIFKDPVRVFTLYGDYERTFANGFPKFDGLNSTIYYEVIAGGKTMLLEHHRQYIKNVRDEINRAPVVGEYTDYKHYYIYKDNKMYKAKLNADAILKILADKTPELNTYITQQKINLNEEADLKKLFNYYNSL